MEIIILVLIGVAGVIIFVYLKSVNSELNRNEKEFKNTIKEANEKIKEEETKLLNTEKDLESKYDEFIVNKPNIQSQINEAKEGLKAFEKLAILGI